MAHLLLLLLAVWTVSGVAVLSGSPGGPPGGSSRGNNPSGREKVAHEKPDLPGGPEAGRPRLVRGSDWRFTILAVAIGPAVLAVVIYVNFCAKKEEKRKGRKFQGRLARSR
jgi:hypothetical protein